MSRGSVVPEIASSPDNSKAIFNPGPASNPYVKRTAIFIQDECLKHRFIRSRDTTGIFERPERLRAVKLGLAAAIARIEGAEPAVYSRRSELEIDRAGGTDESELEAAMARMSMASTGPKSSSSLRTDSVTIRRTSAAVSLLDHPAVKYIHGDVDRDVYLENLVAWARDSQINIMEKGTEIPEGIPPLDLYLCPETIDAIQGALGAVCEAVDTSVTATRGARPLSIGPDEPCERAFVAIRPPGHHCGENTPSGFCFINNVAVGTAHAHLKHGMQRIIILDIDLHHGNGTQSIVWQINEETYRQTLDSELVDTDTPPSKPGPRIFYGSLHDILSFPCEDGKPVMVQAASASIHGPHGQYIENIHLQKYDSEAHFWSILFPRYLSLLHRARDFLDETGGPGEDVIIFISCGFDAGEHEYPLMSRHHRKVPVGFYHRFTSETCKLADMYANGRVVSVLEGGYSDRALTSGAMAHLCGLVDTSKSSPTDPDGWIDYGWWSEGNLIKLEKATKPRKVASARTSTEEWLTRTVALFAVLNGNDAYQDTGMGADGNPLAPSTSMTLRERKKPAFNDARAGGALPDSARTRKGVSRSTSTPINPDLGRSTTADQIPAFMSTSDAGQEPDLRPAQSGGTEKKKLPRVILHVRPPDKG